MPSYLLTGADDLAIRTRRAQLLTEFGVAAATVERFDLEVDGGAQMARSAQTYSMFATSRTLDGDPAAELAVQAATSLGAALVEDGGLLVILRGPKPPSAEVRRALGPQLTVETFPLPTATTAPVRVRSLAGDAGLSLSPALVALLAEHAVHDLPRVATTITQLAFLNLTSPTAAQVERLLGSSAAPGVPWALADALDRDDVATALELAMTIEPLAVVGYLATRTAQLARILESGLVNSDMVAAGLGVTSGYRSRRLLESAQRLGTSGVAQSWDLIAAADRLIKIGNDPHGNLDLLVVRLGELWSGRRLPAVSSLAEQTPPSRER